MILEKKNLRNSDAHITWAQMRCGIKGCIYRRKRISRNTQNVTMTIYNGALKYSVVFICRRTYVLFTLFVVVCDSGVQHILCCYLFVFIHFMYTIFLWTVHFWLPIQNYLTLKTSLSFSKVNIYNTWKPRNNARHRGVSQR
jgi:hypothetical protein